MQVYVGLKMYRSAVERPAGWQQNTTAGLRTGVDSLLNSRRVIGLPIAFGSIFQNVEYGRFGLSDARQAEYQE